MNSPHCDFPSFITSCGSTVILVKVLGGVAIFERGQHMDDEGSTLSSSDDEDFELVRDAEGKVSLMS
ncbi:hypothetical protein AK812_SmicGene24244 [Symbiodinium microadriaticum]|uniref:Uncharacterized protein n=1 Tax=Symbiodinium microadriaticum TaxID=2951 RepID=A0A1Q9DF35_SYMMI|nr:hypothetical protein AK812_SmicGene24244 [Symbiodinium microadriaticum]